jgi:sporulation protein YlmC with PRC-barrel domain
MMNEHQPRSQWNVAEWHGKLLVDRDGEKIGKLQDVYVDVENDEPQFGTVKEGFIGRHLTFVPLGGIKVGPDELQVPVSKEQVKSAPNIEQHGEELSQADESALYHHYELNYTPPVTESGRRRHHTGLGQCDPSPRFLGPRGVGLAGRRPYPRALAVEHGPLSHPAGKSRTSTSSRVGRHTLEVPVDGTRGRSRTSCLTSSAHGARFGPTAPPA